MIRSGQYRWLESYQQDNADLLRENGDFASWLATEYEPIAGGWLY